MISNYLKVAWRNLMKNKIFSFINILGLTLGFTCCLLISLYIKHELSYDKYHKNNQRIYRLANHVQGETYGEGIAKIGGPWAPAAKLAIPEIEEFARFVIYGEALIKQGTEQVYEEGGFFADSSIFKIFSWNLIYGNAATALTEPNSVVLTQSFSNKLFKDKNPIGQTLNINNKPAFKISGVMHDPPPNSHFDFSFFVSLSTYGSEGLQDWNTNQFYTYLLLKPGTSPEAVAKKVDNLLNRHLDNEQAKAYTPFLQLLTDIHLHSNLFREISPNSDIKTIYIFGVIAFIILVIACMNFINLTTANATNRAKEVGIRKATGAKKSSLIKQFILESLLIGLMAGLFAYILSSIFIIPFGNLMGRKLFFNILQNTGPFLFLFGLIILTCIVSSIYPAFVLSSFKPVKVLKGNFSFKSNGTLRRGLVIFQFTLSITLVLAVLVIGSQINYMQQKDLGFNKEQIITIPLQDNESNAKLAHIMDKVKAIPGVLSISASSNQPGGSDWGIPYEAVGLPKDQHPSMRCLVVDENFLNTYNIKLATGRGFSKDFTTDTSAYLINETAAKQLGWKDPIGQQLAMPAIGRKPGPIVGIIKDFHYHSFHEKIEPLYIFMRKDWFSQLNIKIDKSSTETTLSSLQKLWIEIEPLFPLQYSFLDERFRAFYESENKTSKLLSWFTVIAIIISCLGLYSLSTLIAKQRIKEIGVRKVLGASVAGIVTLLSKDFLKPVFMALAIASPTAWYIMHLWLKDFEYRINISLGIFLIAGAASLSIALLTVSFQAVKAAISNPVKSLRTE